VYFTRGKGTTHAFQSVCLPLDKTATVESGRDCLRIRQVVVGVEVAVNVDIPRIQRRVVHMQPRERTGPEVRASS